MQHFCFYVSKDMLQYYYIPFIEKKDMLQEFTPLMCVQFCREVVHLDSGKQSASRLTQQARRSTAEQAMGPMLMAMGSLLWTMITLL
jgi:hypothetical protein